MSLGIRCSVDYAGRCPVSTIHPPKVGSTWYHRLRRWYNIEPTLGECGKPFMTFFNVINTLISIIPIPPFHVSGAEMVSGLCLGHGGRPHSHYTPP